MLDGGSAAVTGSDDGEAGVVSDPVLAGALRAVRAVGELAPVWGRAPLQALARMHMLAAAGLVGLARPAAVAGSVGESELGRPRAGLGELARPAADLGELGRPRAGLVGLARPAADLGELGRSRAGLVGLARPAAVAGSVGESELGRPTAGLGELGRPRAAAADRLAALADVVVGASWSGPVRIAVIYGELLVTEPFAVVNGVVARAAARLELVVCGLDPQALTVPEVGLLRARAEGTERLAGFAAGTAEGVAGWIGFVCRALEVGAREAIGVARAAGWASSA